MESDGHFLSKLSPAYLTWRFESPSLHLVNAILHPTVDAWRKSGTESRHEDQET
jgi:hypothetical protein